MKKMTLFTLFLTATTLLSCSNQEQTSQEELNFITAKSSKAQNYDELYGIQMYYLSAEAEITRLGFQKTKLVAELEKGNKEVINQIENIQKEIEKLTRFNDYLILLKPAKGLKPLPPPQPCLETGNCDPTKKISSNTLIILGKELSVTKVVVKNSKNQSLDIAFLPVEDQFGQNALQVKSNSSGEGIMYTTLKTEFVGEITIPTPVVSL